MINHAIQYHLVGVVMATVILSLGLLVGMAGVARRAMPKGATLGRPTTRAGMQRRLVREWNPHGIPVTCPGCEAVDDFTLAMVIHDTANVTCNNCDMQFHVGPA